ncbi:MAG: carboxymuconolactone decarboxylase family protein [Pseudomonadota bacterium]
MSEHDQASGALAKLDAVRAKRGYLLPHHGLLAISAPEMLEAYDAAYTAMTLTQRRLTKKDKEFVWLAVLISTEEALATHHIAKFRDAGGSDDEIEGAARIAALSTGGRSLDFIGDHWRDHLPSFDTRNLRHSLHQAALGELGISERLLLLAQAAVAVCLSRWRDLKWSLEDAYAAKIDEFEIAEALELTMFPGSVPNFVEACGVWRDLVVSGSVAASPLFESWARMSGQGGYDEAAGMMDSTHG